MTFDPPETDKLERYFAVLRDDPTVKRRVNRIPRLDLATCGVPLDITTTIEPSDAPAEPAVPKGRRALLLPARMAVVEAALKAATTAQVRRRLKRGRRIAVVVAVPTAQWMKPVRDYLMELATFVDFSRDGSQRSKHVPTEGNDEVSKELARGSRVIGVSQAPERLLPATLMSSADVVIRIVPPSAATIADAMRLSLRGRLPTDISDDVVTGLDFDDLVAAMRNGSTAVDAMARLRAAARSRVAAGAEVALPTLQEAIYYGEARDWALDLAQDVAAARSGALDWSRVDRGACFFGVPGTGKSWLARIIARACNLPFIESSIGELFATSPGHLDDVIKAQRAVFARAAAAAPCLLLIDELDAMPNRANLSPRNRDFWLPIIDDFLLQVSSTPVGVITVACTNTIADIDVAILRPGRLERTIEVKPPATAEGLAGILRFHLGTELAGTDIIPLAHLGLGGTAADAMGWVRSARRNARKANRAMCSDDLLRAIAPPDSRTQETLYRSAIHEAGHVIASIVLGLARISHVTLLRTENTGGSMILDLDNDDAQFQRDRIENYAIMALAARAAEVVILGAASVGSAGYPHSDLAKATKLVTAIHASFGLGGTLVYRVSVDDANDLLERDPDLRGLVEEDLRLR